MKTLFKLGLLLVSFGVILSVDLCSNRTNRTACVQPNLFLTQLAGGLCCWKKSSIEGGNETGKCEYMPGTKIYPYRWKRDGYDCGTTAETCDDITNVGTQDYDACINNFVQAPYQCCYVGDGRHNRCLLLNARDTSVYKETEYYLRTYFEDYDGEFEIVCSSGYLSKYLAAFLGLFASLFFIMA